MKRGIAVCIGLVLVIVIYVLYKNLTYEFLHVGDIKEGNPIVSPNKNYSAQIYYENYGGATGGVFAIVNIIDHNNGEKEETIYFADAKSNLKVEWLDHQKLSIENANEYGDRSITLEVGKEIYDETGIACSKKKINQKYTCYSYENKK